MGAVFGWPSASTQYFQLIQSSPLNPNFTRQRGQFWWGGGGGGEFRWVKVLAETALLSVSDLSNLLNCVSIYFISVLLSVLISFAFVYLFSFCRTLLNSAQFYARPNVTACINNDKKVNPKQ